MNKLRIYKLVQDVFHQEYVGFPRSNPITWGWDWDHQSPTILTWCIVIWSEDLWDERLYLSIVYFHVPSPWTIRVGRNTSSMDLVTLWVCYVKLGQMPGPWPHYWSHRKMIVNILRIHRCPEWSSVLGCFSVFVESIFDVLFDEFWRMAFVYFTGLSMSWFFPSQNDVWWLVHWRGVHDFILLVFGVFSVQYPFWTSNIAGCQITSTWKVHTSHIYIQHIGVCFLRTLLCYLGLWE